MHAKPRREALFQETCPRPGPGKAGPFLVADDVRLPSHLSIPCLRRVEASEYLLRMYGLRLAPATLAKMASIGGGPAFHKASATPLYPRTELDRWAVARLGRLRRSTSEGAAE
jgi:hypothetical protein